MHYKRRIATKRALKHYKKARFIQSLISRHLHQRKEAGGTQFPLLPFFGTEGAKPTRE